MKTSWETPGRGSSELPSQPTQLGQLGDGYQEECPATHRDNSTDLFRLCKWSYKMCHWFLAVPKHQVLVPGGGPVVPLGSAEFVLDANWAGFAAWDAAGPSKAWRRTWSMWVQPSPRARHSLLLAKAAILWLRKRYCHLSSCWDAAHYPRLCLSGVTASSLRSVPCAPLLCFALLFFFFFFPLEEVWCLTFVVLTA